MQTTLERDVALLRQSLGPLPEPVARPPFIVVSGLPGSGKSTFSRQLAQRLPLAIVESDALRQVIFPHPAHSQEESNLLFAAIRRLVERLLSEGIPTLLDATNLQERHREYLYHIAYHLGVQLILVWVEAPESVVRERLQRREEGEDPQDHSRATYSVYSRMIPSAQKIARPHFTVNTSCDITPVVEKIVRAVHRNS
ncbi:MAG: ATP-binding protein [Chloroflexi bacterium]|nr:ATP-binding protein [Chloroflexota bacterium]